MQNNGTQAISHLDRIRIQSGNDALKSYFKATAQNSREKAAASINQGRPRFATLFVLYPEIESAGLAEILEPSYRIALGACAKVLTGEPSVQELPGRTPDDDSLTRNTLKWIFLSGIKDDGLSNEFDQIIDISASLLIRTYQDKTILPELVRLIFKRNRKGYYVNDLLWALFGSRDPRILRWIAGYLSSVKRKDVELAGKLLNINPNERKRYSSYLSWLKENEPYLYFTGEGFHRTCEPTPCKVSLEAKYLCRKISPGNQRPDVPLTDAEQGRLDQFHRIGDDDKRFLAAYSNRLYRRSPAQWKKWMDFPLDIQLKTLRGRLGENS